MRFVAAIAALEVACNAAITVLTATVRDLSFPLKLYERRRRAAQ